MKDFEIRCDESRLETNHTLYGKFTLGPFLPGQGTTFGNVLRRSLLSELSGLAITAFEVLGIMQEYSTLPGLRESVLDLSLNFKQVALTGILPYSIPPIGFLKVRGPAVITAADLQLPAGIYCTSPDQYIATLSSNGTLNLKFLVSVGKGYSTQPYSFYRSLSKVKLQSTFSSDINNNFDYLGFPLEQRKSEREQTSFSENIHMGGKVTEGEISAKSTHKNEKETQTNASWEEKQTKKFINPLQKTDNVFPNQNSKDNKYQTFLQSKNSESINIPKVVEKSSSIPLVPSVPKVADKSRNSVSNLSNSFFTSISNANETKFLNSSKYVDIQAQIFQRINPQQVLPIDAVFTPVSQVNFLTQVNDRFEIARENIVLEIWTNGSIHPKRALEEATLSLVQSFDTLLKKMQQSSSFYKGLRYWTYLHSVNSDDKSFLSNTLHSNNQASSSTLHTKDNKTSIPSVPKGVNDGTFGTEGIMIDDRSINYETHAPYNTKNTITSNKFAVEKRDGMQNSSRKYLHRAVYNLDIGNLDLSLETFVRLKEAKINTLAQLLTHFSPQNNKITINQKDSGVKNSLFLSEKIVNELTTLINQFN